MLSGFCCVCHLFPPPVSIFGLFPVLVSCRYELICVQLCMWLCVNYPVYISPVFGVWFRLVYSLLPGVSCLCQPPCPALPFKDYYLSLRPRLLVPVPPVCAPWQKTRPNHKRCPFTSFLKVFILFLSFVCLCLSRGKEVAARNPALAHCKRAWEFGGIAASAVSPMAVMPSCPPIAGDIRRRRWLSQARRLVPGLPLPQRAVRGRSRHQIATDSMPAGPPLTQCPPDRRWLMPAGLPLTHACRIAADSCPPDCRWLKPTGSALTHARWPALTLAPWRVHMSRPGVPCVCFVVPTGTF